MKTGDTVPVMIAGQVVAQATIREMDNETATLIVPGTIVVMGVTTQIAPEQPSEGSTQVLITDENTNITGSEAQEQALETSERGAGQPESTPALNNVEGVQTTTPTNNGAPEGAPHGEASDAAVAPQPAAPEPNSAVAGAEQRQNEQANNNNG